MARERDNTLRVTVTSPGTSPRGLRATLTILSGVGVGRLVELDKALVVGRGEEADLKLDDESLSRRHVRLCEMHGSWFVEDLKSTNGTFLNGQKIEDVEPLPDGARLQLGESTILRFSLQDETEYQAAKRLFESSTRDTLTGCFNRHYLEEQLPQEVAYAKRHKAPLSVLFVDCDRFKQINDRFGHAAGDEVLRRVGEHLRRTVRTEDLVARYGGEELVVVARNSPPDAVLRMAERLRVGVEKLEVPAGGETIKVTVTIGVATLSPDDASATVTRLLARADSALDRGKQTGRNKIVVG